MLAFRKSEEEMGRPMKVALMWRWIGERLLPIGVLIVAISPVARASDLDTVLETSYRSDLLSPYFLPQFKRVTGVALNQESREGERSYSSGPLALDAGIVASSIVLDIHQSEARFEITFGKGACVDATTLARTYNASLIGLTPSRSSDSSEDGVVNFLGEYGASNGKQRLTIAFRRAAPASSQMLCATKIVVQTMNG
jgi:hypothetical protein